MSFARVTVTIPGDLLKAADLAARRLGRSRSRLLAEALRAHLEPAPARVAESAGAPYPAGAAAPPLADATVAELLEELRRRLGESSEPGQPRATMLPEGEPRVSFDRERLAELCRRHHIRKLSLFGSVLREDFRPDSDVDVLVEFEPEKTPGFGIMTIEDELSTLMGGRRVDLVTKNSLHRLIKERVLAEAKQVYAAA